MISEAADRRLVRTCLKRIGRVEDVELAAIGG